MRGLPQFGFPSDRFLRRVPDNESFMRTHA